MSKKLDTRKIETALHKAGRTAVSGPVSARAGRVQGAAAKRTIAASALTQKGAIKRK
jgi:hypothetical protein